MTYDGTTLVVTITEQRAGVSTMRPASLDNLAAGLKARSLLAFGNQDHLHYFLHIFFLKPIIRRKVQVCLAMPKTALLKSQPRHMPQQSRSVATVEAIQDATVQVLLKNGAHRLTTVPVAQRAGVSCHAL